MCAVFVRVFVLDLCSSRIYIGFGADIGVVRHVAGYMLWLGLSSPCRVWGTLNDTQNEERRVIKKMKTKMTAIFAILMIALMAVGVSYALWSKTIYINGTVNTGTFDAIFTGDYKWSATYVDPASGETLPVPTEKLTGITVDTHTQENDPETLIVVISGLYPCITIHIDYFIKNAGTVPWIVNKVTPDISVFPGTVTVTPSGLVGTQVDGGESIPADLEVHIDNRALQSTTYTFSVTIEVVQWNEYPVK